MPFSWVLISSVKKFKIMSASNKFQRRSPSFFQEEAWQRVMDEAERDQRCPRWLVKALANLGKLAPHLWHPEEPPNDSQYQMTYRH